MPPLRSLTLTDLYRAPWVMLAPQLSHVGTVFESISTRIDERTTCWPSLEWLAFDTARVPDPELVGWVMCAVVCRGMVAVRLVGVCKSVPGSLATNPGNSVTGAGLRSCNRRGPYASVAVKNVNGVKRFVVNWVSEEWTAANRDRSDTRSSGT